MALDEMRRSELLQLGRKILADLEVVATKARAGIGSGTRRGIDVLAGGTNAMVDARSAVQTVFTANASVRGHLERLTREPFVARVVLRCDDGGTTRREILYITRASAAAIGDVIDGARMASYQTPLGRAAELPPGSALSTAFGGRAGRAIVEQRVRLRPDLSTGEWDAVEDSFAFEDWSVAIESVRQFIAELERVGIEPADVPDVLGGLLRQGAEEALVRDRRRRQAIQRIALRDQPILDQHQGEVFRLPIDRRLILLGPPGTGKTTTLIQRLAQKRMPEALTEDEVDHLQRVGLADSIERPSNWVMFTPTELLKLYVRDAFAREGVPAAQENLKTWDKERIRLARNVLNILRSGETRGYQFEATAVLVANVSSRGVSVLHDRFSAYFSALTTRALGDAYTSAMASTVVSPRLRSALNGLLGRRVVQGFTIETAAALLDSTPEVQEELRQLTESIVDDARTLGNRLVKQYPRLLEELVAAGPTLLGDEPQVDDDEELDADDLNAVDPAPVPNARELRPEAAAQLLVDALRRRAGATFAGRSTVTGRAGRVLALLGDRLPPQDQLVALGERIVTRTAVRNVLRAPRAFVLGAPAAYARFRREELRTGELFLADTGEFVRSQKITAPEVDVLILVMLKNARALLQANGWRMSAAHDWMNRITSEHRLQVFVDEATDFSAVQLACTIELSHPRVRSWFACGDLNQRITEHGVQDGSEFDWIGTTTGQTVDVRQIRIAYRQSARLRELAVALSADSSALPLPNTEMEYQEVSPLMLEGARGDVVAKWVADRVIEIERALGSVPSIAVFVDGEEQIDPIVKALQVHLAPQNIGVIGCPDGRTVGDTQDVRVFNVQHIKGLEFEAVFFVAVDRLAERLPALFDRYLFVGVSRAATYLGITCESALPTVLDPVRPHFSTGAWA
jgi:hypothetical protein